MGGITSVEDALQFIMAGARAVAVGTGIFYDPELPAKIVKGIRDYMITNNMPALELLEGVAHKGVSKS